MSSPLLDQNRDRHRTVLVERDDDRRSRVADTLSETCLDSTLTIDLEAVSTARDALEVLSTRPVDCVVLGEVSAADHLLSTLETDYPPLPVVSFTAESATDASANTDAVLTSPSVVAHVDASSENATALLTARLEAVLATNRANRLEGVTRAVTETATDGVALLAADGRIAELVGPFAETFGRGGTDLSGQWLSSLYEAVPVGVTDVLAGESERWTGSLVGLTPNGDRVEREHDVHRVTSDTVACVVHPRPGPSEREEVMTDHLVLRSMLQRLPISLYAKDDAGRHIRVSHNQVDPPIETPSGDVLTKPEEFLGKTDCEIFAANLSDESFPDDRRVIETGESIIEKLEPYETIHGNQRWTTTSKVPWTDTDGTIRGLAGVTVDITAEIEHEREVERQHERLEQFASVVAHDLRNPLNVARGYVALAQERSDTESLEEIERSLDRMEHLIEDILALARQGNSSLDVTSVSLREVSESAWEQVSTGDATLRLTGEADFRADHTRLCRLVENLVRNAVEHGGESVTVTISPLEDEPGFAVEDTGPGIPLEQREQVFESGYTTSAEGTGFGLAIVSQIVEAHGWEIDLTDGEDGGARFEITGLDPCE